MTPVNTASSSIMSILCVIPFSPMNIRAFRQMLALLEQEKFDLVHCNTPIGGVSLGDCAVG